MSKSTSLPGSLRNRSTADVVVVILALVVAFVIVFSTVGLAVGFAVGRSPDIGTIAKAIGDLTSSLIALLVGYLAGRGANGKGTAPPGSDARPDQEGGQ